MDLSTAPNLMAAIAETINRADLTATIPAWIRMAESGFNQTLRLRPMIRRQHAVFSGAFSVLPADFLEMKSVAATVAGRPQKLFYGSEEILDDIRGWHACSIRPTHFTIIGNEIEIAPAQDTSAWDVALTYYSPIPPLDTTVAGNTNWLLQKAPQLYLYAALLHSAPYLVEDDRLQVWSGLAQSAVQTLQAEDDASIHSGSQLRERFRSI